MELEQVPKAEKENGSDLSPREEKFLEVLFEDALGDVRTAMKLAGYGPNDPSSTLLRKLRKEIQERSKNFIAAASPQAIINLLKIFQDPTYPGAKNIISAAKEVLDRSGVVKEDVNSTNHIEAKNVFILPAKQKGDFDAEN